MCVRLRDASAEELRSGRGDARVAADLAALNARVYAELFLTPDADPWLGLDAAGEFAALDQGQDLVVGGGGERGEVA